MNTCPARLPVPIARLAGAQALMARGTMDRNPRDGLGPRENLHHRVARQLEVEPRARKRFLADLHVVHFQRLERPPSRDVPVLLEPPV